MSVFSGTIFSKALNKDTHLTVILPQDSRPHVGINGKLVDGVTAEAEPKTLILLHGATDIDSTWVRRTSLERYAELYDVAVVMPDAEMSSYANMVYGPAYYDYVTEELPELASQMFKLSVDPGHLYIAGLSMGSIGTIKCFLTHPERYVAAGAFSGAGKKRDDKEGLPANNIGIGAYVRKAVYGDPPVVPEGDDPYYLADHMTNTEPAKMYMCCGKQDFLHQAVVDFRDYIQDNSHIDLCYEEWDGIHEWGFWDLAIQKFFDKYMKK
ncbi:MAG: esterase family protein [Oscillospiraceae bacterium]|nr:esterase family protein [Oscillospiraceae bacterium]